MDGIPACRDPPDNTPEDSASQIAKQAAWTGNSDFVPIHVQGAGSVKDALSQPLSQMLVERNHVRVPSGGGFLG